jgi:hypothetical protein
MTETEWLIATTPDALMCFVAGRGPPTCHYQRVNWEPRTHRKALLYAAASCRAASNYVRWVRPLKRSVEMLERHADGADQGGPFEKVWRGMVPAREILAWPDRLAQCAAAAAQDYKEFAHARYWRPYNMYTDPVDDILEDCQERPPRIWAAERRQQCDLMRCIFGNPFRPVVVNPAWLTPTVVQLARGIYEGRAFDGMPPLADALQDAGCQDEEVLRHCLGPGPHARGCWVLDLLSAAPSGGGSLLPAGPGRRSGGPTRPRRERKPLTEADWLACRSPSLLVKWAAKLSPRSFPLRSLVAVLSRRPQYWWQEAERRGVKWDGIVQSRPDDAQGAEAFYSWALKVAHGARIPITHDWSLPNWLIGAELRGERRGRMESVERGTGRPWRLRKGAFREWKRDKWAELERVVREAVGNPFRQGRPPDQGS